MEGWWTVRREVGGGWWEMGDGILAGHRHAWRWMEEGRRQGKEGDEA
jgi:hypothetical protein